MLDRSISYKNIIMRCDHPVTQEADLPAGYKFMSYKPGSENDWASLEHEIGDFTSHDEALRYFHENYMLDLDELERRCVFVENKAGQILASCLAWHDDRKGERVGSLHWLVVHPEHQGLGIGKATLLRTMQIFTSLGEFPVYLHTQPWSFKAIVLYAKYGFSLMKEDTFSNYVNEYPEAIEILKKVLNKQDYLCLVNHAK
jgi:ribosomal protein S18 acetylase RimI-like enzyme